MRHGRGAPVRPKTTGPSKMLVFSIVAACLLVGYLYAGPGDGVGALLLSVTSCPVR